MSETPDEWLLHRYDCGDARKARQGGVARALLEVIEDHSWDQCPEGNKCLQMSGEANWPRPRLIDDLATYGTKTLGLTFHEVMSRPLGEAA